MIRSSVIVACALLLAGCPEEVQKAPPDAGPVRLVRTPAPAGPPVRHGPVMKTPENDRFLVPLGDSPSGGKAEALVTAVLFGDLTEPETARVFFWLQKTSKARLGELRWVFKHYPSVRPGDTGMLAAKAAIVADRHGRFEAFAADLLANPGPVDSGRLAGLSKKKPFSGLDWSAVVGAKTETGIELLVNDDRRLAARVGVKSPPGMFFNGRRVGLDGAQLETALDRELKEARALVAQGTPAGQVYERLTRTGRRSAWMKIQAPDRPVPIGDRKSGQARGPDDRQTIMVPPGAGIALGPAGAPVELVVFVELGCSICARMIPVIEKLRREHPRDLRVSVRILPGRRKRPESEGVAVGLMAVAAHPKALALLQWALTGQRTPDDLRATAAQMGVPADALAAGLARPEPHLERLNANRAAADRAGVRGSPYLFVNGRPIPGATNIERLERMIAEELARRGRE